MCERHESVKRRRKSPITGENAGASENSDDAAREIERKNRYCEGYSAI
jgi:hypothetical protein